VASGSFLDRSFFFRDLLRTFLTLPQLVFCVESRSSLSFLPLGIALPLSCFSKRPVAQRFAFPASFEILFSCPCCTFKISILRSPGFSSCPPFPPDIFPHLAFSVLLNLPPLVPNHYLSSVFLVLVPPFYGLLCISVSCEASALFICLAFSSPFSGPGFAPPMPSSFTYPPILVTCLQGFSMLAPGTRA